MAAYPEVIHLSVRINDALTVDEDYYCGAVQPSGAVYHIQSASFLPMTTVTADAADYRTLTISDGTTTFGTLTTESTAGATWTAGTPSAVTLSGKCEIKSGTSVIKIASAHAGSTGAVADGHLAFVLVKRGA